MSNLNAETGRSGPFIALWLYYVMGGSAVSCQEDVSHSVCLRAVGTDGWGLGPRIPGLLMAFLVADEDHFHFSLFLYGMESHSIEYFHSNTLSGILNNTFHHLFGSREM